MKTNAFLHQLYLRALTPFEIRSLSKVKAYTCSDDRFNTYLNHWISIVSKFKSTKEFEIYCSHTGVQQKELRKMLSTVTISPEDITYPEWISSLQQIIDSIIVPCNSSCSSTSTPTFLPLFTPFLDYFATELLAGFELPNQLATETVQHLQKQLYRQLFAISKDVLDQELSNHTSTKQSTADTNQDETQQKFIISTLRDKYQFLFLKYPMLARRLTTTTNKYINAVQKLTKRFYSDQSEIEYFFHRRLPAIHQLHLGQGDFHNGEATVIIEFADCSKIVYKPRSISITLAYNAFLNWVNEQLNEQLRSFRVIDKQHYGWLEFVDHVACQNEQEVRKYFERAGILLGITYFLNSIDCHYENLIAAGDCPVIIDHETMIAAKLRKPRSKREHAQVTPDNILADTVLTSMLLPNSINKSRAFASGFGSSAPTTSQQNRDLYTEAKAQNKPSLNGKVCHLVDYQEEFKQGFRKLFQLVVSQKEHLRSEASVLNSFEDKEIRFINRSTNVYYQILKSLNKVKYLSDATRYGLTLEILARAFLKSDNWSVILASERRQMLAGDIPFFNIAASAEILTLAAGEKINMIEQSAVDNIIRKIDQATTTTYEDQVHLIEESISL